MQPARLLRTILTAALLLAAGQAHAQDSHVLWLKTEWPPVFTAAGKGFGDHALRWLQQRLPAHSHETRSLPLPRLLRTMDEQHTTVCTTNLLRTPAREEKYLISRDIMRMPALSLVVRTSAVPAFAGLRNARGEIEFTRLMQQTELDGVINENRSYGPVLDSLLRAAPSAASFARLPKTGSMVSMLAANRVDWILLYPFEAVWLARQEQTAPVLSNLPIAEIPAFGDGGVTCNRTVLAEKLVADINRVLAAHPDEPWLTAMFDWLDPETRQRIARR